MFWTVKSKPIASKSAVYWSTSSQSWITLLPLLVYHCHGMMEQARQLLQSCERMGSNHMSYDRNALLNLSAYLRILAVVQKRLDSVIADQPTTTTLIAPIPTPLWSYQHFMEHGDILN